MKDGLADKATHGILSEADKRQPIHHFVCVETLPLLQSVVPEQGELFGNYSIVPLLPSVSTLVCTCA
jgi:hypothetical protein